MKIDIFVSYSSADRDLRELLVDGLKGHLVHRDGYDYHFWTDASIDLGAAWEAEIEKALDKSNVALLLVSANFAASQYINTKELTAFFKRKKEEGYLILPVLVRQYDFSFFEKLAVLNFFKTYYPEYGFNKPIERKKLLPFDKLAEDENTTNAQLNLYYAKLAEFIHRAVVNAFSKQANKPENAAAIEGFPWRKKQIKYIETFGLKENSVFQPYREADWYADLENDAFILENQQNSGAVKYHYVSYPNENMAAYPNSLEVKIEEGDGYAGLLSCFDQVARTYYAFIINREQEYRFWLRDKEGFKMLVSGRSANIHYKGFNKLGLIRNAQSLYLFINDVFIRRIDNDDLPSSGHAGLIAIGKGKFIFDNLTFYEQ